jgi:uncharacterized membrane protein (UPF0127 family)
MERPLARRLRRLPTVEAAGAAVPLASGPVIRLLGLAFLDREPAGEGLLFPGCRSVHTFGMRFPLDVVFIDRDGEIVRTERAVGPRRVLFERCAAGVLEMPAAVSPAVRRPDVGGESGRQTT